jgi:hypothetical protein
VMLKKDNFTHLKEDNKREMKILKDSMEILNKGWNNYKNPWRPCSYMP